MATLILAAAGQAVGGMLGLGTVGAVLGRAAGAVAGSMIDSSLFGSSTTVETGKLADLSVQASTEGASLPRIYGRVRLAGQVIWATNFEEVVSEETSGGKGGGSSTTTVRSYSYYGNFAVALCLGPVSRIGRVWADGTLLDTSGLTMRTYLGSDDQAADPLIAATQENTPAYRGVAYVVFERLALENFGNRLPQLTFEVVRSVGVLESQIRAVTIIPGAGEFVYAPTKVTETPSSGTTVSVNRHITFAMTDWEAALDELQALCPNLESVALVVTWFGDDLRAGHCTFRPKVEETSRSTSGMIWQVGPTARSAAEAVSRIDDRPAFGGTPSDASVLAAIADLKSRGLRVVLYPFLMMDIPTGNGLEDPYGSDEQAVYPWRGRITTVEDPEAEIATLAGTATASNFSVSGSSVGYSGPNEWGYRRFILHHAFLAEAAGGVDAFLIGSELRGLTRARTSDGGYPFVSVLTDLAQEVREVLGADTKLSYAADWSEYGADQVSDTELRFPLDALWGHEVIDFIGIDNYFPLSDFREGGDPDGNEDAYDLETLRSGIAGGEYYDWYYLDLAAREAANRSAITDGAYSKPFVYRAKDLKGWWANAHYERVEGAELSEPTAWQAEAKPIWFTELGVPAIDKGANEPNVFVDPKSSESETPWFSSGARDDAMQRSALEASLSYWDDLHPDLAMGENPTSSVYDGRMVDGANLHLWTWDARPYPAFPSYTDVWSDGDNWLVGHWLNGRLGGGSLGDFLKAYLDDLGISTSDIRVAGLSSTLDGLTVAGPVAPRSVIEPLLQAFDGIAADHGTEIVLMRPGDTPVLTIEAASLVETASDEPLLSRTRAQASELSAEIRLSGEDALNDFSRRVVASRRLEGGSRKVESQDLAVTMDPDLLWSAANARLHRLWAERESAAMSLEPSLLAIEAGDTVELTGTATEAFDPPLRLRVGLIEDTDARKIEAVRTEPSVTLAAEPASAGVTWTSTELGTPHAVLMDLPLLADDDSAISPRLALYAKPWGGSYTVMMSPTGTGYSALTTIEKPATMATLVSDLAPGPEDMWDEANILQVSLLGGTLQSLSKEAVLAGGNALAVETSNGSFEILQFRTAELVGDGLYNLSGLLRARCGTEAEMAEGALSGANVIVLGTTTPQVPVEASRLGLSLSYRIVPAGQSLADEASLTLTHAASGRGLLPLSPVHLKAVRTSAGILVSWVRRTRLNGDSWQQVEVPLGEESEAYELDILSSETDDTVQRTLTSSEPQVLYESTAEQDDFGATLSTLTVSVVQLSATAGRGRARKAVLHV